MKINKVEEKPMDIHMKQEKKIDIHMKKKDLCVCLRTPCQTKAFNSQVDI